MAATYPATGPTASAGRSASAREQLLLEKGQHLVERVARGRARLVDEVVGEHRVGTLRMAVRVAPRRVDLHADEVVAELLAETLKALGGRAPVVRESEAQQAEVLLGGAPRLHP